MVRDSLDEKRVQRSTNWPETQGIVVNSQVVWAHVEVRYEYWISSESYKETYELSLRPVAPDRYDGARPR
jgi:hypothetical protein